MYTLSQRFTGRSYVGLKQNQNMTSVFFTFSLFYQSPIHVIEYQNDISSRVVVRHVHFGIMIP